MIAFVRGAGSFSVHHVVWSPFWTPRLPPTGSTAGCALVSPTPPQGGSGTDTTESVLVPLTPLSFSYRSRHRNPIEPLAKFGFARAAQRHSPGARASRPHPYASFPWLALSFRTVLKAAGLSAETSTADRRRGSRSIRVAEKARLCRTWCGRDARALGGASLLDAALAPLRLEDGLRPLADSPSRGE